MASATFSVNLCGSYSIRTVTRLRSASIGSMSTVPAWRAPVMDSQATRRSGTCSVTSASNSRVTPPTVVTQWVRVSDSWRASDTPPMNWGNSSNCVHWLYAVRTGTATSTDSVIVVMSDLLSRRVGGRGYAAWVPG